MNYLDDRPKTLKFLFPQGIDLRSHVARGTIALLFTIFFAIYFKDDLNQTNSGLICFAFLEALFFLIACRNFAAVYIERRWRYSVENRPADQLNRFASSNPPASDVKLTWYQHAWAGLPIGLVAVGGAIGGGCGFAAYAVNLKIMHSPRGSTGKYLLSAMVSGAAVAIWIATATLLMSYPD